MDWYRARILNVGLEEEKGMDPNLPQPVLMVVAQKDPIGDPKFAESMKEFVGDLTWKEVDAGHWLQLEKSEEVNGILEEFFSATERK
jgi:soluble epoxide hydrolase / lipid-phosphate phosphatase